MLRTRVAPCVPNTEAAGTVAGLAELRLTHFASACQLGETRKPMADDDKVPTQANSDAETRPTPVASTLLGQFPFTSITELDQLKGDDKQAKKALGNLCQRYWYPLYAFLRRRGHGEEDAKDLTQGFFAAFLSGKAFEGFDPSRGKLRSYLLGALKHFESNWKRHSRTIKAGGEYEFVSIEWLQAEQRYKSEPQDVDSPDLLFDRRWALTLLENVRNELRDEYTARDQSERFEKLRLFLDGMPPDYSQAEAANELGMTRDAFKTAVSRMRGRRREILRSHIARTVASETLIDEEIKFLLSIFETGRPAPGS